jgi:D-glycero-D-manno-heptose 1,7-bisphosphate phosphatase
VSGRSAVFLDRDGTIIEDAGYLRDPADVRLLPGAGAAVRELNQSGLVVVVVTNQSGIARGLLTLGDYRATERRVDELLKLEGAVVQGHYFCPHLPELNGPCECRKPGVLLYRQASERFGIDLSRSWWVGDRLRDVQPAQAFGGSGILLHSGGDDENARSFLQAPDLKHAAEVIVTQMAGPPLPDYLPPP